MLTLKQMHNGQRCRELFHKVIKGYCFYLKALQHNLIAQSLPPQCSTLAVKQALHNASRYTLTSHFIRNAPAHSRILLRISSLRESVLTVALDSCS